MTGRQILGWLLVAGIATVVYNQESKKVEVIAATPNADEALVISLPQTQAIDPTAMANVGVARTELDSPKPAKPMPPKIHQDASLEKREISKWRYQTDKDEMRGVTNRWATLASDNSENFSFPYNGGSHLRIVVRDMPKKHGRDVYLEISKGQVNCGFDGCRIPMKFDNGKIITYTGSRAGSGFSDTIFIAEQSGFLKRIRTAKKLMIEVPIYKHGPVQFSFSPEGLDWK